MLAQSWKTADELRITEPQKDALIKTLVLLETGKIRYSGFSNNWPLGYVNFTGHFNMATWGRAAPCGTVACIGGTAEMLGGEGLAFAAIKNRDLGDLFEPSVDCLKWIEISTTQAATALRSYLTTGHARWDLALA